jgi:hypothetical protein
MIKVDDVPKLYKTEVISKKMKTSDYRKDYVNLDITMAACLECPNYSLNWACPEFDFDALRFWQMYDNIELIFTKILFTDEALSNSYNQDDLVTIVNNSLFRERNLLISHLEEMEKEYDGKCLSAGYCGYCERCSRMDNRPCKYPDKCHNSIESIGGLVGDTLSGVFGEEIKWIDNDNGKLPEKLSLLMAVLY